jgi:uncharacterized repeat protein (TIGR01451 family)
MFSLRSRRQVWSGVFQLLTSISLLISSAYPAGAAAPTSGSNISLHPLSDTFVASGRADRNFANSSGLWLGYDQNGGFLVERTLIRFQLPAELQQGTTLVTSAKLYLYLGGVTPANSAPMLVGAHPLRNDWPADITWSGHLGLTWDSEHAVTKTVSSQLQWYEWDIQGLVQDWVDHPAQNFGLILLGDESAAQHERGFWSNDCSDSACGARPGLRPRLDIVYEPRPTSTPTATPTATSTATPTPTATARPSKLDLQFSTDPMGPVRPGDLITYTIGYRNTGGANLTRVVITGSVPGNTEVVREGGAIRNPDNLWWEVGPVPMKASGEYSYTVRVKGAAAYGEAFRAPPSVRPPFLSPTPASAPASRPIVATPTADEIKKGDRLP